MFPSHPNLKRDRDDYRRWYLDEDVFIHLSDGHTALIRKGYRFDGHSTEPFHWFFSKRKGPDIYAAMVHDFLIDTEMFHRFNRKFIDDEYTRFMNKPEYITNKLRTKVMPKVVRIWGFLKWDLWGDDRGIPKPNTHLEVTVYNN